MKTLAVAMFCVLLSACAAPLQSATPPASPNATIATTASLSPIADAPYRLSVIDPRASPGPTLTISTPADCDPVPSDWLRQVCALTLRSPWQGIVAATDLFNDPTTGSGLPTWWAGPPAGRS